MANLLAAKRNKLPKSEFGMPGERKYPMPDKSHAANAKARATQQEEKGNLSESEKEKIDAKANRVLGEKGGKMKGKKEEGGNLEHFEVHKGAKGGHKVVHHFESGMEDYKKPEEHMFGPSEGKMAAQHVMGLMSKMGGGKGYGASDAENEDEDQAEGGEEESAPTSRFMQ